MACHITYHSAGKYVLLLKNSCILSTFTPHSPFITFPPCCIEQKSAAIDECVRSVLPQIAGGNEEYWAEKIQTFGLHKDAAFCNLLANLGELVSESRSTGYSNLAPIDAAARLNQMRSDPQIMGIINNQHHPKNRDLSHEFRSLIQIKNGEW